VVGAALSYNCKIHIIFCEERGTRMQDFFIFQWLGQHYHMIEKDFETRFACLESMRFYICCLKIINLSLLNFKIIKDLNNY